MLLQKQKITALASLIFLSFLVLSPVRVLARGLVPCGGYVNDQTQEKEPPCTVEMVFVLIARVTNWLLAMVGVFAIYNIISAGFYLAISMGDEEKITAKKNALTNAVIGFALALTAFMFVNTVVNYLLLRGPDKSCRLNLADPLTYLQIDEKKCVQNSKK